MDPSVSVIIATYNRASLLTRSVNSVLSQSYENIELIIVDDCSPDDTGRILAGFNDKRVRCIRLKKNIGQAAARNLGIREARSQLVAFQDDDDEWLPGKLSRQMAVMLNEKPDVGVVYTDMIRVFKDKSEKYFAAPSINGDRIVNRETGEYAVTNIGIQSTVIKRECFDKVGYFNEKLLMCDDLDLFIRLSMQYKFHHIKEPFVRYYETGGISASTVTWARARRILLTTYFKELLIKDKWFIAKEIAILGNMGRK